MIFIDGSQGEGGGQILRTSLSLSVITGKPLRIFNIRAGRKKPGLMRQHLTAVTAAGQISAAEVRGAEIGSRELQFVPGEVIAGEYRFSIGTAGSATLVLQTVLPPLLTASAPSQLSLEGGTHNLASPPFDFLKRAFLPIINRMGPAVKLSLLRPGFYPAGGGQFNAAIRPAEKLAPIDIPERGKIVAQKARAMVANLPRHIAERELKVIQKELNLPASALSAIEIDNVRGPGNVVFIEIVSQHITEVFSGFGEKRLRAETVAGRAAEEAKNYLESGAPVGPHLADQLLLPFALAGGGSFITRELSEHTKTNITVILKFLDVEITVEDVAPAKKLVKIFC
jgi:RNA 3'-terminal phosphate cyclase (ATP)